MPIYDFKTEFVETGDVEISVRVPNLRPLRAGSIARDLQHTLEKWTRVGILLEFVVTQAVEYKEVHAENDQRA
jgi:hypothetical protein